MQRKILEHMGSLAVVAVVFAVLAVFFRQREDAELESRYRAVAPYLNIPGIDFSNPQDRALFRETLDIFYPRSAGTNDSILAAIESYRQSRFTDPSLKAGSGEQGLSGNVLARLAVMFIQFVFVYCVTLALTLYGSQTLGIYRFVTMKQGRGSYLKEFLDAVRVPPPRGRAVARIGTASVLLLKALLKGISYAVLFSPAYVIGYSFKTNFEGNSVLFMILLGVVSNGLLITYANKFTTLLDTESRKGYVETALVKGLSGEYGWGPGGIAIRSLFRLPRSFDGHVLDHLYRNARYQYRSTLKEQATFLITGLIIIEMALNIQGHLCYALLQDILYRRYDVALTIVFLIFLLVKVTEILVDLRNHREGLRYEDAS